MTESEAREAINKVFEHGRIPESLIIYADYGDGHDKIAVSCVGPIVDLYALFKVATGQCADLLNRAAEQRQANETSH